SGYGCLKRRVDLRHAANYSGRLHTRSRVGSGTGSLRSQMPTRRTKRGSERTTIDSTHDGVICGASFAGLATARELAGTGARVLILDRYEIGERQTSACAAPTAWLEALDLDSSISQTFDELVVHTPHTRVRLPLPWSFSTFDYPELCRLLA